MKHVLKKVPGLRSLVRRVRFFVDPRFRSEQRLIHTRPDNLFQPSGHTVRDRYPRLFSFVRDRLAEVPVPRLLSYGCSTGEEVFTLKRYFPAAEITGIDINPRSIEACRGKLARRNEPGIRFELAGTPNAEPDSFYDAIFCMAVLRHGELGESRAERCDHLIRFDDFETTVAGLCRVLKPGGYLLIRHSNFRFADTASAPEFDVISCVANDRSLDKNPIYDKDNSLLEGCIYTDSVFRKRETAEHDGEAI